MRLLSKFIPGAIACLAMASPSHASIVQVQGKIVQTQGHITPACRMVLLKRSSDGAGQWFRIPDTGNDNSIMSVTLTAVATGLNVIVTYDTAATSGCGTEPAIQYISILSAN